MKEEEFDKMLEKNLRKKYQILKKLDDDAAFERFCNKVDIEHSLENKKNVFPLRKVWTTVAVAAVLLVIAIVAVQLFVNEPVKEQIALNIPPGKECAYITTSNGKYLTLDDNSNINEEDMVASIVDGELKIEDGQDADKMNLITIPRGGEYRITLPDGTHVHLNAESSLEFPSHFSGMARTVKLTGEAYFDVAKNDNMPFIVEVGNLNVKQYGTHYNINAYDERQIEVTLVEGSIALQLDNQIERRIIPGHQAVVRGNDVSIKKVDIYKAVSWNEGIFSFEDETLSSIASTLSRWYNTEIDVDKSLQNQHFSGSLMRDDNLADIMEAICEVTNTTFEYNNNTIKLIKK